MCLKDAALDRKPDLEIICLDNDRCCFVLLRRLALGLCREKVLRITVLRVVEDVRRRAFLDDFAAVHDIDTVGHFSNDAEIVRDQQHRHAEFGLQLLQKLQDLRLYRDVERCRRFVGDQEFRFVGERQCNHHALTLAARQLVRVCVEALFRIADADLVQKIEDALANFILGQATVDAQDLADLLLDGVERVE